MKTEKHEIKEAAVLKIVGEVREMVSPCIQCGTCTGSCPNAFAMDFSPRMMWRMVLTDHVDEVFSSRTFGLCSSCYYCTLRCPRGLPLTEAMSLLKQAGRLDRKGPYRKTADFYRCFLDSVRKHGRVKEMEFMTMFFISARNPLLPLRYASLGLRLMIKGKTPIEPPLPVKNEKLGRLFKKVREVEERE